MTTDLGISSNYNKVEWYDEFDTKNLDLGPAVATYQVTKLDGTNVYWREFQKGYVYVNPTPNDVRGIPLPQSCKQLNHGNFKGDPSKLPSAARVDLQAHRAAILLKHGAK